MFGTCELN